ncbi:hypothetical protein BDY21DRAFT_284383 [Lineolata rhizophorae]|uniref:Solute carrier family 40 member n=1 Tax=Lineolata rhizophorae TaxID=578093 RepID=A0A6A6P3J9_9PEZI|nr:hypothetical protein BDY21DRAFT_284383 [Lineolata rhizophorae]
MDPKLDDNSDSSLRLAEAQEGRHIGNITSERPTSTVESTSKRLQQDIQLSQIEPPSPTNQLSNSEAPRRSLTNVRGQDGNESNTPADVERSEAPAPSVRSTVTLALYISHFLSTWNARLFEFGAVLFLASIYPDTLRPMSIYALVRSAAAIAFSPPIGRYIDRSNRLSAVRVSIVGQRFSVVVSCIILYFMETLRLTTRVKTAFLSLVIILACSEKLAFVLNTVAVERDWVVVITDGREDALRVINARMRRIDLFCKLIGPLVISFIDAASTKIAALVTLGMSLVSVFIEYFCIARVYTLVPSLHRHPTVPPAQAHLPTTSPTTPTLLRRLRALSLSLRHALPLRFYFTHRTLLPSLCLSLLYLTVLSFSAHMTAFLLSVPGWTAAVVGGARAAAAVAELSATWVAPRLMARVGPLRAGIWCAAWLMAWVGVGVGMFWGKERLVVATGGLVAGVGMSRLGLWGFDLCMQVIIQEEVEAPHRGAFSAVEAALQNLFELCSYASTIAWARPDQFRWPVLMSAVAVYLAGGLYATFLRKRRGHLVHNPMKSMGCIPREL